jgi:pyrimidine-specific ribonucleoside hydrolase
MSRGSLQGVVSLTLLALLFLAGCSEVPAGRTAASTPIPPAGTSQSTPPAPTPQPRAFPLAGTWAGSAWSGDFEIQITITLESSCQVGETCGTFDIPVLPCSGSFILVEEIDGVFEFGAADKVGSCGEGRDFLQILPDGTMQYTSWGSYAETRGILQRTNPHAPTQTSIIVDDDGSIDGVIALLYFLRNPAFDVRAVTVSCGEAHPGLFARHILRLLAGLGRTDIPVGAGRDTPLAGNNTFPEPWRQNTDNFWGLDLPEMTVSTEPVPAAGLIIEAIAASPGPVVIFVSGNHTNLAEAMRIEPAIAERIQSVHIMGGAIYAPGNIYSDWPAIENSVAEWNIWVDPLAARDILASGLQLHVTPLDATNQVIWTQSDAVGWASSGSPEGTLAGEMLQWMIHSWYPNGAYVWDLVAAINASDPVLCPETQLSLDVITTPGPSQGQVVVTDHSPNAAVCLDPDAGSIRARAIEVLGE